MRNNDDALYDDIAHDRSTGEKRIDTVGEMPSGLRTKMLSVYDFIDVENEIVYLIGPIHEFTLYDVMTRLRTLVSLRESNGSLNPNKPITLFINSTGGLVYEMYGLIDFIEGIHDQYGIKINTVCRGSAMSAAAILLSCGTGKRVASTNSVIMLHEISMTQQGTTSDIRSNTRHMEMLQDIMYRLLAKRTKKDVQFWKTNLERDYYLTAAEALELGIIDDVI